MCNWIFIHSVDEEVYCGFFYVHVGGMNRCILKPLPC
jgi:hypothetical protein